MSNRPVACRIHGFWLDNVNGPYSLLIRASYFVSCSVHARFASVLPIN